MANFPFFIIISKIFNVEQVKGTEQVFHFKTQTIDKDDVLQDVIDDSKAINKPMEIILGKQFKMPIWEECLKSMRVEEIAEFRVEKNVW